MSDSELTEIWETVSVIVEALRHSLDIQTETQRDVQAIRRIVEGTINGD